ncbi:stalk domain-containing protein [Paenibacillus lignilyticus]|uniref:Copper amine oxidase-like N-terminal domain-containing protein n=1 Tax=Paenibacillus lignilyticus TaxID=1172615 RepID=A0ABS5CEP1_9BACL|nr:stalk domain-containing protein [Paenibacillus lignilyticus]MBP3961642.1 hypothetical protein [Paenibacillus lignilyticus]MBP3963688.1 hypothetical protein [Paenibacillus lignilyticus]
MSMKKTLMISALAAALSTSAVSAVSAASVTNATTVNITINDTAFHVRSIQANNTVLYALRDLGTAAGVQFMVNVKSGVTAYFNNHAIELHAGSNAALVDGEAISLEQAVQSVNGSYYVALEDFVSAFGVDSSTDASGLIAIDAVAKVHADDIRWIDADRLLASQLTEEGRIDYIVNAHTGAYTQLLVSTAASDLTVAPNGKLAVYTDGDGIVNVIDLTSKVPAAKAVSTDNSIKPELVWSADSSAIYFLQGDKGSVIAKLNVADGVITKVLDDKVDYKSGLAVSADGKKFFYTVIKPGAVTADANKPVDDDDVAIDNTGTEPQLYSFDFSVKDSKPVKLTTTTDDKVFVGGAADGSKAFYVSVEDNKPSSLVAVALDKTVTKLIGDKDVLQAIVVGDKIYALADSADVTSAYEVNIATGAVTTLGKLEGNVSEVVAAPGTPIAFVIDDAVYVKSDSGLKKVTN